MSSDAISALKRGAVALLTQCLAPVAVFDGVPRGATAPWVSFGDAKALDVSGLGARIWEVDVMLDVWSQQPGSGEALAIAGTMARALHHALLPLDGHAMLDGRIISLDTTREDDWQRVRLTWRAVVREV